MRTPGRSGTSNGAPKKLLVPVTLNPDAVYSTRRPPDFNFSMISKALSRRQAGRSSAEAAIGWGWLSASRNLFGLGGYHACSAPQDRKGGHAIHPLDGSPSLFAHLSGALRAFLRGPAPAPPQPLKRLAKLLCCSNPFGAVVDLGKLPFFRANLPFFAAILREFEIFFTFLR